MYFSRGNLHSNRSKYKHLVLLVAVALGNILEHKSDGSLWIDKIKWLVPYIKSGPVEPSIGTHIIADVMRKDASPGRDKGWGLWDKVRCKGGYHLVNKAIPTLAIGCNAKMELICVALNDALIWTD